MRGGGEGGGPLFFAGITLLSGDRLAASLSQIASAGTGVT